MIRVHVFNWVTCAWEWVWRPAGIVRGMRHLTHAMIPAVCTGIVIVTPPGPPAFAHSPPPPPAEYTPPEYPGYPPPVEYTPPEYPGYPAIPGTPIGGYPPAWGYTPPPISTPPISAPPGQHVETFTPAVISTPPGQHVETFTPAVITELCDTPPTIIPPDCDTVPVVSHVPEPSGLLVIGTALFTLGVILMAARSKPVVPHIRWVVLVNGEAES